MTLGGDAQAQAVALAGLFQSLTLVQELARSGGISDPGAYASCMASVLRIDADSAPQVYGGNDNLRLGIDHLLRHLEGPMNQDRLEQARYAAGLMFLERQLSANKPVLDALAGRIGELAAGREPEDAVDLDQVQALAELYVQHVSPLGPRVLVSGNPTHLKSDAVAARIRALLLAGIRAAVLWRQSGGGRLSMLLMRRRYARIARALREALPQV